MDSMKRSWLTRLIEGFRGYGSHLDEYEMAIVEAVALRLESADADKLRQRARAINRVQRLLGGQDTTLYQMRSGRPVFPTETAIIHQPGSVHFARVAVRSANPMSRLRTNLFLHDGNLSSLEFDRPSEHSDAGDIDEIYVTILGSPFADPDLEEERTGWPSRSRFG